MKYPEDFINKIICGDCLEVMKDIPDESIDTIITDPPYLKKYIYLYEELAIVAKRILKPGGSLVAITPHYAISEIIPKVSEHLKWRWIHCIWQAQGAHPRMAMGIEVMWKPICWWVKGAWPRGRGFVRDGIENIVAPKKTQHKWEQSELWAEFCLKIAPKGGLVLDPFVGSGTTIAVAKKLGYNFIGIDNSEEYCEIARKRLAE